MAEHYCPNCKQKKFSWFIDEEAGPYTQWRCSRCDYVAQENEAREMSCTECNTKNFLYFKTNNDFFRFCIKCQYRLTADPW
jgi:DNA-directed RNA polymerase subunit RPC12/RpoP